MSLACFPLSPNKLHHFLSVRCSGRGHHQRRSTWCPDCLNTHQALGSHPSKHAPTLSSTSSGSPTLAYPMVETCLRSSISLSKVRYPNFCANQAVAKKLIVLIYAKTDIKIIRVFGSVPLASLNGAMFLSGWFFHGCVDLRFCDLRVL